MELADAERFAEQWAADWNSHDIDRIMRHFRDDVVFVSPAAERIAGTALVRGKAALRSYWAKGLDQIPDLHFEVCSVQFGVDTAVITYLNQRGQIVSEVLTFEADVVVFGRAAYGPPTDAKCHASVPAVVAGRSRGKHERVPNRYHAAPSNSWAIRTQTLSQLGSTTGSTFSTIVGTAKYTFNPATGNTVTITFTSTSQRYLRLNFTANTGWPACQAAEFEVFSSQHSAGPVAVNAASDPRTDSHGPSVLIASATPVPQGGSAPKRALRKPVVVER